MTWLSWRELEINTEKRLDALAERMARTGWWVSHTEWVLGKGPRVCVISDEFYKRPSWWGRLWRALCRAVARIRGAK